MPNARPKLLSKCFILVFLASLGLNLCQNILNNSVTLYVTSLGRSTGFAGFLGIPYAVMAILMRFVGGDWVDRRSRRSLLAFGCFGFAASALLFQRAEPTRNIPLIFFGNFSSRSGENGTSSAPMRSNNSLLSR